MIQDIVNQFVLLVYTRRDENIYRLLEIKYSSIFITKIKLIFHFQIFNYIQAKSQIFERACKEVFSNVTNLQRGEKNSVDIMKFLPDFPFERTIYSNSIAEIDLLLAHRFMYNIFLLNFRPFCKTLIYAQATFERSILKNRAILFLYPSISLHLTHLKSPNNLIFCVYQILFPSLSTDTRF